MYSSEKLEELKSKLEDELINYWFEERLTSSSTPFIDKNTGTVTAVLHEHGADFYTLFTIGLNKQKNTIYAHADQFEKELIVFNEKTNRLDVNEVVFNEKTNRLDVNEVVFFKSILAYFEKKCFQYSSKKTLYKEIAGINVGDIYSAYEPSDRYDSDSDGGTQHFYEVVKNTGKTIMLRELAVTNIKAEHVPEKYRSLSTESDLKYHHR